MATDANRTEKSEYFGFAGGRRVMLRLPAAGGRRVDLRPRFGPNSATISLSPAEAKALGDLLKQAADVADALDMADRGRHGL